jgi:hypothetical protein
MALNELIAQGAQFKAPDLLGQYATMQTLQQGMQQNQMNQLNMTEKSRSLAEQEGLRNYLRSNPNLDTPEGLQGLNQYGGAGQLLLGSRIKQKQEMASAQKSAADAGKTEYETTRMKLTDSLKDAAGLTTPGAAITHIQNAAREGKIPQDKAEQLLATIPQDIEGFGKWRQQMMFNLLSAQNQLEQHFGSIDNGQTITQFSVPKYAPGATPNVIAQQQKQLTPGAAEANDIARGNLEVNRGRLKLAEKTAENKVSVADTKKQEATGQLDDIVASLNAQYDALEKGGGIVSTDKGTLSNLAASAEASALGQYVGKALGTQNQSARNQIGMTRPQLLMAIKNASGMTARQLDSNADLKLWLQAATDPQLDVQANRAALNNIVNFIGKRSAAPTTTAPASTSKTSAPPAGEMAEALRWAKANPNDEDAKRIIREFGGR